MPSKKLYLKSVGEFRKILNEGRRTGCPHFIFCFAQKPDGAPAGRLGISASKVNIPLATQRNRIKRLIRELWRKQYHENAKIDLVIRVKNGTDKLKNKDISGELTYMFDRIIS